MKTFCQYINEVRKKDLDWSMQARDQRDAHGHPIPQAVYWGLRDAMHAEVSTPLFYPGKYLVQPVGEHEWDAQGANNLGEVRSIVKELKHAYPHIRVFRV